MSPGEVVLLPLWVRGRGGGRQTVRMLLRYKRARVKSKSQGNELEEPPKPSDDALFRCVCVCIKLRATAQDCPVVLTVY